MYADLHVYTNHSHGTNSPWEVMNLAQLAGIKVISITDHDCVEGVREARRCISEFDIKLINGVELSSTYAGKYVNVLGYHINIDNQKLISFMKECSEDVTKKTLVNFQIAKRKGAFDYSWDRVLELNPNETRITGIHVVYAMNKDGYIAPGVESNWVIFRKYFSSLAADSKCYRQKRSTLDAIDVIKSAGGIPILAHPKLIGDDRYIQRLIEYGAEGLEVYHSTHTLNDCTKYLQMAEEHGLYITGGSGWRGDNNHAHVKHFGMQALKHGAYGILRAKNKTARNY